MPNESRIGLFFGVKNERQFRLAHMFSLSSLSLRFNFGYFKKYIFDLLKIC